LADIFSDEEMLTVMELARVLLENRLTYEGRTLCEQLDLSEEVLSELNDKVEQTMNQEAQE